jgi:anti-anti-sigma factor
LFECTVATDSGLKWLIVKGRVDGITSPDIQARIKALIAGGERIIVTDLRDVNYMSSVGLRVFLTSQHQLKKVGGEIVFYRTNDELLKLFDMSGFDKIFRTRFTREEIEKDFGKASTPEGVGEKEVTGILLRYIKQAVSSGKLFTIGSQENLPHSEYTDKDLVTLKAKEIRFGTGLASLGESFEASKAFFGEAMVINRHFYFYPAIKHPAADFMLCLQEDSDVKYQFLHGFGFNGDFACILSFEGIEGIVGLNAIVDALFEITDANKIGIVMLAESKGFWGMHLKQVPIAENRPKNNREIFDSENFANWMNFPVEPDAVNHIVAGVGIAVKEIQREKQEIQDLIAKGSHFHLHAGILDKAPLSKDVAQFEPELDRVLTQLDVYKIQHVLGQSRFGNGLVGIVELS